jgi:ribosome-binding protein aMBF1 (putative translation factor)
MVLDHDKALLVVRVIRSVFGLDLMTSEDEVELLELLSDLARFVGKEELGRIAPRRSAGKRMIDTNQFAQVRVLDALSPLGPIDVPGTNKEQEQEKVGRYIRSRRVAAGINSRDMAKALNMTHVQLEKVERGLAILDNERYCAFLSQLRISAKEGEA